MYLSFRVKRLIIREQNVENTQSGEKTKKVYSTKSDTLKCNQAFSFKISCL